MLLSDKYPFLTNYFTTALTQNCRPLPQGILFYGNDFDSQYTLAKEIARILNCKQNKDDNCECIDCRWIRDNFHPAVITISKLDSKPLDDDSKTVISIKQSAMVKEKLISSSDYHRVFIFCDRNDDGKIAGLNHDNFQAETANSLLKIIEEPQPGVTFIFLTRSTEDVLSTIISRCQTFFVASTNDYDTNFNDIVGIFDNYWEYERKDVFDISQKLQILSQSVPILKILEQIQNFIAYALKSNPKNYILIEHFKTIENAKKQAVLGIKPTNIFDELCLNLIK